MVGPDDEARPWRPGGAEREHRASGVPNRDAAAGQGQAAGAGAGAAHGAGAGQGFGSARPRVGRPQAVSRGDLPSHGSRPEGDGVGRAPARSGPQRAVAGGSPAGPRRGASREEIAQREYDPRREERRKATRVALPEDVDPRMLDAEVRGELRSLSKDTSDLVARHLVVTGHLLEDDPEQALAHARAARALAGRIGVVREAAGLAAYAAGKWAEALSELRAARRITGRPEHLGVFADCERALGRPERALAYADDPQLAQLSQDQRVELVIVLAGARRDLGQADAAVLALQDPARRTRDTRPWAARLWYAYADALLEAGREAQAREWFGKAAGVDVDGETDAGDRVLALDGVVLEDTARQDMDDQEQGARPDLPTEAELAELVRGLGVAPPADVREPDVQESVAPLPPVVRESEPAPVPVSGVLAPTFVAAPNPSDPDQDEDQELRLFD